MSSPLFITTPNADYKTINLLLLVLRDWEYSDGDENSDDFVLVTSHDSNSLFSTRYALRRPLSTSPEVLATSPPIDADLSNEWIGAEVTQVEKFCLQLAKENRGRDRLDYHLFLLLDERGIREKTLILGERAMVDPDDYDEGDDNDDDDDTMGSESQSTGTGEHEDAGEGDTNDDSNDNENSQDAQDVTLSTEARIEYLDKFNKVRVPWHHAHLNWVNLHIANMGFEDFIHEDQKVLRGQWCTYRDMEAEDVVLSAEKRLKRDKEIERMRQMGKI